MHKIYLTLLSLLMLCSCVEERQEKEYGPPTQLGEYLYFEMDIKKRHFVYHSDTNCPNIEKGVKYIPLYEYTTHKENHYIFCKKCFNDKLYYDLTNK